MRSFTGKPCLLAGNSMFIRVGNQGPAITQNHVVERVRTSSPLTIMRRLIAGTLSAFGHQTPDNGPLPGRLIRAIGR